MNYFLLSICCVLISFTAGKPVEDELYCMRQVDKFLGGIKLDKSVQELVETSKGLGLDFFDFAVGEFIQFKDGDHKALMAVGYKESCDGVLKHFKNIGEQVDCFKPGSILEIGEKDEWVKNMDVIWAGLACSYTSRWKPEGRDKSTPFFDFIGSSEAKKECLREMTTALEKVRPDAAIENLIKLNREHELTIFDIMYEETRPIDQKYQSALDEIYSEASCEDLHAQIEDVVRGVYCAREHILGHAIAQMELYAISHARDVLLARNACKLRIPDFEENCRNKVAKDLNGITLDDKVKGLVQYARNNKLTHVHFAATKYQPLDDKRHRELADIKYPKGCDGIVKHFSKLGDRVKCTRYKSFNFMKSWFEISEINLELRDRVLAGWACAYALKFDKERPESADTVASEPFQPVKMIDDEQERKRIMDTLANFNADIKLDASLGKVVEIARGCKLTFVDFVIEQYQPLDEECSRALLKTHSWRSCEKLNSHVNVNKEKLEFYQKNMQKNWGVFIEFLAKPDSEGVMLANEACEYIRKHGKEPKNLLTSLKSKLKWRKE